MRRLFVVIVLLLTANVAIAAPAWYHGKVTRIYLHSDGFILTLDSGVLDDCIHKYVYYRVSLLSESSVNRAYSMALAAQSAGKTLGTVIDKAINGPGGICDSNGSMDIKD